MCCRHPEERARSLKPDITQKNSRLLFTATTFVPKISINNFFLKVPFYMGLRSIYD